MGLFSRKKKTVPMGQWLITDAEIGKTMPYDEYIRYTRRLEQEREQARAALHQSGGCGGRGGVEEVGGVVHPEGVHRVLNGVRLRTEVVC
jgi:hypothetical protein